MNALMVFLDCLRLDRVPLMRRTLRMVGQPGWYRFANHRTVAQCSDPNFLTILTGAGPDTHQVHTQMGTRFVKRFPTLQYRLAGAGYDTWAYELLDVPAFYRDGFKHLVYHRVGDVSPVMAPAIKQVLRDDVREPWFGFMRVLDTHYPYNGEPLPEDRTALPGQYDRAVAHVDRFTSHLVRWVLKYYPDTLVIIGADHGEMLGDYGGLWDHLFSLRDRLTRVPLYVYQPDTEGGDITVRTQHQLVTGMVLAAAGMADWPDTGALSDQDVTWMTCWGAAGRDEWRHRALVVSDDQDREWKYTVDWSVTGAVGHALHLDGDETVNHFGDNDVSRELSGWMAQEYPTTPRATGTLEEHGRDVLVGAPRSVPLGGIHIPA